MAVQQLLIVGADIEEVDPKGCIRRLRVPGGHLQAITRERGKRRRYTGRWVDDAYQGVDAQGGGERERDGGTNAAHGFAERGGVEFPVLKGVSDSELEILVEFI